MKNRDNNHKLFLYKAVGIVFIIIMAINVMRELTENRSREFDRGLNRGAPRRLTDECGADLSQYVARNNGFIYMDVNKLRKYDGVVAIKAKQNVVIAVLPDTGFYTILLRGNDITAGIRMATTIQIGYDDGMHKDTWAFVNLIYVEFRDMFAIAGSKITATYNAPTGYITYVGINLTVSMRKNVIPPQMMKIK